MSSGKRNYNLDLVKTFAMFCVIGLHMPIHFHNYAHNIIAYYFLRSIFGLAIPLFFMVSGYLLLGRVSLTYKYVAKKIGSIIKFIALVTLGYWLTLAFLLQDFNIILYFKIFIGSLIQRGPFSVFWYFGAICIIYLCSPFINKLYLSTNRNFYLFTISISLICSIIFLYNMIIQWGIEQKIIQSFRLYNWILYFSLGGLIKKIKLWNSLFKYIIILYILYVAQLYVGTTFYGHLSPEYFFSSPITQLFVFFVFREFCNLSLSPEFIKKYYIQYLSNLFLPVYVFHTFVISFTKCIAIWLESDFIFAPVVYWGIVCIITIIIAILVMRIPYINRIFRI